MAEDARNQTNEDKKLKGQELLRSIEMESAKDAIPSFCVGDTVEVSVRIQEGDKTRVQAFIGTCITRTGSGLRENFTVRRIVQGEGVERVFPVHSPSVVGIKVTRRGKVRRSRLFYLRERTGRAVKVKERLTPKPK